MDIEPIKNINELKKINFLTKKNKNILNNNININNNISYLNKEIPKNNKKLQTAGNISYNKKYKIIKI